MVNDRAELELGLPSQSSSRQVFLLLLKNFSFPKNYLFGSLLPFLLRSLFPSACPLSLLAPFPLRSTRLQSGSFLAFSAGCVENDCLCVTGTGKADWFDLASALETK